MTHTPAPHCSATAVIAPIDEGVIYMYWVVICVLEGVGGS